VFVQNVSLSRSWHQLTCGEQAEVSQTPALHVAVPQGQEPMTCEHDSVWPAVHWQLVAYPMHAPQVPSVPHVSVPGQLFGPPVHPVIAVGVHDPVQLPLTHAWLTQGLAVDHVPFGEHVSTPLFEHFADPAAHTPHTPAPLQKPPLHGIVVPHWPVSSHVWVPLPEQAVAPGEHTPTHFPPTHAWFVHALGAPHIPLAPHVCRLLLPEHCVVPGEHDPAHCPPTHA
jgi:hypothetical protein